MAQAKLQIIITKEGKEPQPTYDPQALTIKIVSNPEHGGMGGKANPK